MGEVAACQELSGNRCHAACNCRPAGMLKLQQGSRAAYPVLRKAFRLFVEQVNEVDPSDVAYVHACYAPLSIRLVEHAIARPGKQGL